jgi:hypothetical protein
MNMKNINKEMTTEQNRILICNKFIQIDEYIRTDGSSKQQQKKASLSKVWIKKNKQSIYDYYYLIIIKILKS